MTVNTELPLTLVTIIDRLAFVAIRLIAPVTMLEIQLRLALENPAGSTLLASDSLTILAELRFTSFTMFQLLAAGTGHLGTNRALPHHSTVSTVILQAVGAFHRGVMARSRTLHRQERTVFTDGCRTFITPDHILAN